MWKAAALSNGAWNPLTLIELPPEPFRSDTVRRIMRERFPNSPLIHYFEQEAESADAARDAIERWGTAAQAEAQEFDWDGAARVEALNEALGLYASGKPFPDRKDALATLAWHDRTGVIIPLLGEEERITVEYQPALRDEYRVARLQHNYATPEHRLETILDWRGYFGTGSLIGDGWTTMRRRGHGFIASVEGTVGYVVASVLRRLTRDPIEQGRDPTARRRLIAMSERYPQVAEACPDLSSIEPVAHDCAIVFVHGTVSCGIQGLKDLYPSIAFPLPIYRYEHDTFQPLHDNASELAELIATRIQVKRLLLAAHSRGGLVARLAQVELEREGYQADVSVFTFGTPHEGTPLVALGGKALNLLLKLGEDIAGTIPIVSPLTKAYSYLMEEPSLPRGIEVMREGSEGLLTMRLLGNPARVHCWGSNFDEIGRAHV